MANGWNHRDITIVQHSISGTFENHHSKVAVGITSAPHPHPQYVSMPELDDSNTAYRQ